VAVGLRNAGLFATETRRRVLAETLREVSTVLASSLDLPSVLDGILLGLDRVVSFEAALILLRSADESSYSVSAARGATGESDLIGQSVPADSHLTEHIENLMHVVETPEATIDQLQHDRSASRR
jgi:hypothetical protein